MTADQYLRDILARESVDTSPVSPLRDLRSVIMPICRDWAGDCLVDVNRSGSFAKGTANKSGTDIDFLISLSPETPQRIKKIYQSLQQKLHEKGYAPRRRNASLNIKIYDYNVDLVPAKRQSQYGDDLSLYRCRADAWTKTNVTKHIIYVRSFGRHAETRVVKLWRDQTGLEFPSFYLELTVINALYDQPTNALASNVMRVFEYIKDHIHTAPVLDPANTDNVISDDMNASEKTTLASAAAVARSATHWEHILR